MDWPARGSPSRSTSARGAGQLLFDMGVTGDFIGNLTQSKVDKANARHVPRAREPLLPPRDRASLFGQIDPYARAEVRFEAGEEDAGEIALHLAEANLTLMALPFGTQAQDGPDAQPLRPAQPDPRARPAVHRRPERARPFLGDEGLVEHGAELTWVAPLPFFLEALVGVFNGDNETAFGRGKLTRPARDRAAPHVLRARRQSAIQLGASVANGRPPERRRNTLLGFDAKYKYTPEGWQHPLLTVLGEMIYQNRRVNVARRGHRRRRRPGHPGPEPDPQPLGLVPGRRGPARPHRTVEPLGRRLPLRLDPVPDPRGHEWAVGPYVAFMPSEFLRFRARLQAHRAGKRDGFTDNESSARKVDEILFQATFILGAHPAHPF